MGRGDLIMIWSRRVGVLAGPGLLGFVSQLAGLRPAFALVAVLLLAVPIAARRAVG